MVKHFPIRAGFQYVNRGRPSTEKLGNLIAYQQSTGADVIKLVVDVVYITDVAPVFNKLTHCQVLAITRQINNHAKSFFP